MNGKGILINFPSKCYNGILPDTIASATLSANRCFTMT